MQIKNGEMILESLEEVIQNPNITQEKKDEMLREEEERLVDEIRREFEDKVRYCIDIADIKIHRQWKGITILQDTIHVSNRNFAMVIIIEKPNVV